MPAKIGLFSLLILIAHLISITFVSTICFVAHCCGHGLQIRAIGFGLDTKGAALEIKYLDDLGNLKTQTKFITE